MEQYKKCNRCEQLKDLTCFCKNKAILSGYNNICRECASTKSAKWQLDNKEYRIEYKKKYREENANAVREYSKKYYWKNRDKVIEKVKKYVKENRDKVRERTREYTKRRIETDPVFRATVALRKWLYASFKRKRTKKGDRFTSILGMAPADVKAYIEERFEPGMCWDNYGKWHIDHKVPLATAKTEEDVYKLCHYTNLQPLWASDNIKKGAKI